MTTRELIVVLIAAPLLCIIFIGGLVLLLGVDWSGSERTSPDIDCANSDNPLCHVRNFLNARNASSAEAHDCLVHGLPANCADQ